MKAFSSFEERYKVYRKVLTLLIKPVSKKFKRMKKVFETKQ